MTTGFFVAATVAAIVQFVRVRDRRLLPLMAMFALLAAGQSRPDSPAARPLLLGAGLAGLVLVVMLGPHHPHPPERPGT